MVCCAYSNWRVEYCGLFGQLANAQAQSLLASNLEIDEQDNYGRTPLLWAAEHGHAAAVMLLLLEKAVDVDCMEWGQMPLS